MAHATLTRSDYEILYNRAQRVLGLVTTFMGELEAYPSLTTDDMINLKRVFNILSTQTHELLTAQKSKLTPACINPKLADLNKAVTELAIRYDAIEASFKESASKRLSPQTVAHILSDEALRTRAQDAKATLFHAAGLAERRSPTSPKDREDLAKTGRSHTFG